MNEIWELMLKSSQTHTNVQVRTFTCKVRLDHALLLLINYYYYSTKKGSE